MKSDGLFVKRIRTWTGRHPKSTNACLVLFSIIITLVISKIAFRGYLTWLQPKDANTIRFFTDKVRLDDSSIRFKPHPYLSYVRSDTVYVENGIEIQGRIYAFEKPAHTIRVACLGGSTTMNQFSRRLEACLERRPDSPDFEVMDFGCDGWTLQESTINYLIRVIDFKPDIVLLHHGANDGSPFIYPDFLSDYSHFRKAWKDDSDLILRQLSSISWIAAYIQWRRGVAWFDLQNYTIQRDRSHNQLKKPPQDAIDVCERRLRQLACLVQTNGGKLIVAPMAYTHKQGGEAQHALIEIQNTANQKIAKERSFPISETDALLQKHPDWFKDTVHLTLDGNSLKSASFRAGYLARV